MSMEAPVDDRELIRNCQQGDRASFDMLVGRHYALAYHIAYRMLSDHDLACDATQSAFVRAYKALPRFRSRASFSTWLYRIVTNVCLDQLRQRQHAAESLTLVNDDDQGGYEEREMADNSDDPADASEQKARQRVVRDALDRLGIEHKQVLVMYDLSGLSYEEIAGALGVPLGTVKSRLNRARHALKEELAAHMELFR